MPDIVNLRQARKRRDRAAAEKQAESNRLAFGRSKAERRQTEAERDKAERGLDGHRLETRDPPEGA